ncbi:hypothetical protein ACFLY2_01915 [Patescibacteria group bacterium]
MAKDFSVYQAVSVFTAKLLSIIQNSHQLYFINGKESMVSTSYIGLSHTHG